MCTSIVHNGKKTIAGFNLDILGMEHRVTPSDEGVYIEINDAREGWLPLFGANARGDFVGMPTCHPYDERSNPSDDKYNNIIILDIDLLLGKKTFSQVKAIAESGTVCSVPGITYQAQLSDRNGNVLQIVPGQGYRYFERPTYSVLTNFSPFKGEGETHPWMGLDRYAAAEGALKAADDEFDVSECFAVLKAASQTVCPTVVSMVFDVDENAVYWCENRAWEKIFKQKLTLLGLQATEGGI